MEPLIAITENRENTCKKNTCKFYKSTNFNLRDVFCNDPKSIERCICLRKFGETGMFYDPQMGQHYFS